MRLEVRSGSRSSARRRRRSFSVSAIIAACLALTFLAVQTYHVYVLQYLGHPLDKEMDSKQSERMTKDVSYKPATTEEYVMTHMEEHKYEKNTFQPSGCELWTDESLPIHADMQKYVERLDKYNEVLAEARKRPEIPKDLRVAKRTARNKEEVCKTVDMDLVEIFGSELLSHTSSSGFVEPLLPPMRHPKFCRLDGGVNDDAEKYGNVDKSYLLDLSYLVHDFGAMCRRLKPTSRTVFIDMGASLEYHNDSHVTPAMHVINMFRDFGMPFDHVYAFEVTPTPPERVFQNLPDRLMPSYHWINVGVDPDPKGKLNPLTTLLENGAFEPDDLIIVKLDVDTTDVEVPLAHQLLDHADVLAPLVDQFYFEHHVKIKEMKWIWRTSSVGSVKSTLDLFRTMREKGIPSHFWV